MAKDQLFNKYIWFVDTISRYGRITREQINELWRKSSFSYGEKSLPRRTFYSYRNAVQELFSINIECDPATFEYYIEENDTYNESVTHWLLDSVATNDLLSSSRDISHRLFLENVPSAREYLGIFIDAVKLNRQIRFDYYSYSRSLPTQGILFEAYFLKIFRNRWYVIGRNIKENMVKTYALDRIKNASLLATEFKMPDDFIPAEYFRDSFGIVASHAAPKKVALKVVPRKAKYLRALPLHESQQEMIHDQFSIFYYTLRITDDLVEEILSCGPDVTVLDPPELRAKVITALKTSLENYANTTK
jgi:hypothetical protein